MSSEGMLAEVRPGRHLWVQQHDGAPGGAHAHLEALAVLLHGSCAHCGQWDAQVRALNEAGIATIAYDAFGCGRSHKPVAFEAYAPEELYADAAALLARHGAHHRALILVAHSFGALLALRLAAAHADRVTRLVLVGAFLPPAGPPGRPPLLFRLPLWLLRLVQPWLTAAFLRRAFHPATWDAQPGLLAAERAASNANPPHMFAAFYRQLGQAWQPPERFQATLAAVRAPTLLLCGQADQITPPAMSHALARRLAGAASVSLLPQAGHQAMQEQPQEVNRLLLAFIAAPAAL